ncbi:tetratricopeptide repeat-containing sensor histidine kinase [Kordia jejudonensis]|uniref:tetratricopeptide repeat-containing sensor histidine kinase n=1 Tax=Kordia jejudonensis TaxID=1348245 RepID=UPI00138E1047|nr:ATP-binding protein [Kordia jejudonensis]
MFRKKIVEKSARFEKDTYFNEARSSFLQEKWDSTLVYTAKQLVLKNNDPELTNYCHFFRGYSFQEKKLFEQAEQSFLKITPDFYFYYHSKAFLGGNALEQHKFEKAIAYYKSVEHLKTDQDLFLEKSRVEHNIGLCYLHLQQFDKAEYYLLKSTKMHETANDTINLVSSYGDLANLYYEQYKDEKAIPYFEKAYQLSKYVSSFNVKATTALNMSIVEENKKQYANALSYRKEFEQWNDSVNNQNKIWNTVQSEKQIAILEKDKDFRILEAYNNVKIAERNGFIYSSIFLLILLGAGTYLYREKIKATKIINDQKKALNELNTTKDYLFSVVSHDLRSPVNALRKQHHKLQQQVVAQDFESLQATIETSTNISESMYGLLTNILHWSLEQRKQLLFQPKVSSLQPIITQVIFDFESLAAAKNIVLTIAIDNTIMANFDRESLKIILRNLIDNAIKYTPEAGTIEIHTSQTELHSHITIKDTGIGFSQEQLNLISNLKEITISNIDRAKGVGLGLLLCTTLATKNNGELRMTNNKTIGATITIVLPNA